MQSGVGDRLLAKYRQIKGKLLAERSIRRRAYDWCLRRGKDLFGLSYDKALAEHILGRFRAFKEKMMPWHSRRRMVYQKVVGGIKNIFGIRYQYRPAAQGGQAMPIDLANAPKVSVVIPVYDRTDFLKESIESILTQTYRNFELILVCDGSPAETLAIVNQYKSHSKVRIFIYRDNSGTSVRGRNRGIKEAWGKYLAFLDSDDIAEPNRLGLSVKYMEQHDADLIYGSWRVKNEKGCRNLDALCYGDGAIIHAVDLDYAGLLEKNLVCQSTVMAKTEVFIKAGGLRPGLRYCEDYELWLRLVYLGHKFKAVPEVLATLRFHSGNLGERFIPEEKIWRKKSVELHKMLPKLKPTIAFVIPSQGITGGTAVICQHANRFLLKGYDVLLIDNEFFPHKKGLEEWLPEVLPQIISINDVKTLMPRIDIAISTSWQTVYTVKDMPIARKIYFIQSDETRLNPPGSEESELARRTYEFGFEMIVIAKWLSKWLKNDFGKTASYIPNGLDNKLFFPYQPLEPKSSKLRVLLEGPIDVVFKGMKEAFEVVDGMDVEVWCISSGGRPKPGWKCDRFFEKVPLKDMRKIYSSCDVLIKMSKVESFAMPPLEMMACGGTVIINKVTGYEEYIVDGVNALVVELGDVKAARQKLEMLIKDRALLKRLVEGGIETAKNWSWDYSNDKFVRLLEGQTEIKWPTDAESESNKSI
ncbi:MAG: glycosyltransferase [Planctomycetota bacterium]